MANAKLKCKTCKKWSSSDDVLRIGMSSFCDWDCYNKKTYEKKDRKATEKSLGPSKSTVDAVLTADGFKCRLCGSAGGRLVLHHIFYRSEAKHESWVHQKHNLISLHNEPCHLSVVHKDKHKFQPLLLALVWIREYNGYNNITAYHLERMLENGTGLESIFNRSK